MVRLSGAQRVVERMLMLDQIEIFDDQDGLESADVDPVTLKVLADTDDRLVYRGKAEITPGSYRASTENVGGVEASVRTYTFSIPIKSKAQLRPGQRVRVIRSIDPTLNGAEAKVGDVKHGTLQVSRDFSVDMLETSRG